MAKRRTVKVSLERVTRTDLICVSCGRFRCEWAILPVAAGFLRGDEQNEKRDEYEPQAGVHTKCIDFLHAKFTRKKAAT
jgi:hypothetical protein